MGAAQFVENAPPAPGTDRFSLVETRFGHVLVLDRSIVSSDEHVVAIVHIGERLTAIDALIDRARMVLLIVALVAAVAIVCASIFIARAAIDPIERLTAAMEEIGSERLDRRLHWTRRRDEVGKLAATFDAMLARLQEAFARERQFISDASHELKTPLTVINANAQMLARWADRDPTILRESLEAIIDESSSLAQMVNGMLTLAKAESGDAIPKEPVDLAAIAHDVVTSASDRAREKGLMLESEAPEAVVVAGDINLLRQLVTNLVENAIKFTDEGGVTVSVTSADGYGVVRVADTGVGIDRDTSERLFDRFFRADRSHSRVIEGTGLGLAIVRSIARVHDGSIEASPRPEGGSLFTARLPLAGTVIQSS